MFATCSVIHIAYPRQLDTINIRSMDDIHRLETFPSDDGYVPASLVWFHL